MNDYELSDDFKLDASINHYYNKITVDINGKEYLICNKVFGKTDYSKEIDNARKEAKRKGIIK